MPSVKIQMKKDGVMRYATVTTNPKGYSKHAKRDAKRAKIKAFLVKLCWKLLKFVVGLLVASLYGFTMFYVQNKSLWFCVYTTLVLALLTAFAMGVSTEARICVLILLPTLCSSQGRKILLLFFASLLMSGPITNTVENVERAAVSVLCESELAANQTQELLRRSADPLAAALEKIRVIARDAYAVAGRIHKVMEALTDGVRHLARGLRNVFHFLTDIGDECNRKLGSPYRKCHGIFLQARRDCDSLLKDFNFLCHIVDLFMPFCKIARAAELFCVVPQSISRFLKRHLATPTIKAFEKLRHEFEFNITASLGADVDAHSSQTAKDATQKIFREITSRLKPFQMLSQPLTYVGLFLLALSFYKAVVYKRKYLEKIDFDNFYISRRFRKINHRMMSDGKDSALPLHPKEEKTYITPLACKMTRKEWKRTFKGVFSVLWCLLIGCLVVGLDFLLFWIMDQVQNLVKADVVARSPVLLTVAVNGSGISSSIIRDLVHSFDTLQKGNITVISKKCLRKPSEPNINTCFFLGFLLGLALLVSVFGGFLQRLRRVICDCYYPEKELERLLFLHQTILDERRAEEETTWQFKNEGCKKCLHRLLKCLPDCSLPSCWNRFTSPCADVHCQPRCVCCRSNSQEEDEPPPGPKCSLSSCCNCFTSPCADVHCQPRCVCCRSNSQEEDEHPPDELEMVSMGSSEGVRVFESEDEDEDYFGTGSDLSDLDMSYQYEEPSEESDGSDGSGSY